MKRSYLSVVSPKNAIFRHHFDSELTRDFTTDNVAYNGLKEFVNTDLNSKNIRFIPILDPAISIEHDDYDAFETCF